MPKSRHQKFSSIVFDNVRAVVNLDETLAKKYKGLCKRAGSLVRTSGLMQTLAFMEARGSRERQYHLLLRHLQDELLKLELVTQARGNPSNNGFWITERVRGLDLPDYMVLTRNALMLLNWHKRLADTLIEGDPEEEEND